MAFAAAIAARVAGAANEEASARAAMVARIEEHARDVAGEALGRSWIDPRILEVLDTSPRAAPVVGELAA